MQQKACTKCDKSVGSREERWGLGWEQGLKKPLKHCEISKWKQ